MCLLLLAGTGEAQPEDSDPADPPGLQVGRVSVGGYIQYDFLAGLGGESEPADDTFRFRRVRLQLEGDLTDDIAWAFSGEFTATPILRDAFIVIKYLPAATLHLGQLVMPYGLERYIVSANRYEFTERLLNDLAFGRDAGIMVSNQQPLFGWMSYAAAVVNGRGQNQPDDNGAKDVMGRFMVTPPWWRSVTVGANAARGRQPLGMRTRAGGDITYETRRYHLAAEYLRETLTDDGELLLEQEGFYGLASWRWYPPVARRGFDHLELAARYGAVTGAPPTTRDLDLAVNYYALRKLRFMFDTIVSTTAGDPEPRAFFHFRANILF
jgi:phosphate-selective porin